MDGAEPDTKTMSQENKSTTMVRNAVATSESVFLMPHFARMDVKPAKTEEKTAAVSHIWLAPYRKIEHEWLPEPTSYFANTSILINYQDSGKTFESCLASSPSLSHEFSEILPIFVNDIIHYAAAIFKKYGVIPDALAAQTVLEMKKRIPSALPNSGASL